MPAASAYRRNLSLILWIRICFSLLFVIPVVSLYWQRYGMDLQDIFLLQAIFALSVVLLEVPTGFIGDRIGRKKTLLLACGIAAAGWTVYALADSFAWFVVVEVVLGVAFSFLSGTDTALLYESLDALGEQGNYTSHAGRQFSHVLWAEGLAGIAGALTLPFLKYEGLLVASGLSAAIGLVLALKIREPVRTAYCHPRGTLYGLYKIARFVFLRSTVVRRVLPLMAACGLATMLGVWLYQPYWTAHGVPLWAFGLLWAGISLVAGAAGRLAPWLEKKLGDALFLLLPVPVLLGYLAGALLPGTWGIIFLYMVPILRGLTHPVLSRHIHEETYSDKRATVLSIESWLFRILYTVTAPVIGLVGRKGGLEAALLACAAVSVLLPLPLGIIFFRSRRSREPAP